MHRPITSVGIEVPSDAGVGRKGRRGIMERLRDELRKTDQDKRGSRDQQYFAVDAFGDEGVSFWCVF
jgi:hypothetical protein